jgi:ankyrin repeat protein
MTDTAKPTGKLGSNLGFDQLRAAAAAGRTIEVQELLNRQILVDVADPDGETALMKSIRADQPATAALLIQHGASLDKKNKAGFSARDLATQVNDPALNRALGLEP